MIPIEGKAEQDMSQSEGSVRAFQSSAQNIPERPGELVRLG